MSLLSMLSMLPCDQTSQEPAVSEEGLGVWQVSSYNQGVSSMSVGLCPVFQRRRTFCRKASCQAE